MKTIRAIVLCIFAILFFINCILLFISGTAQALFSPNVSNTIIENINLAKPFDDVLQNIIGENLLKESIQKQVQQIEKTIKNSEEFKKIAHAYTLDIIDSIAGSQAPKLDFKNDMERIINTYQDELKTGLGPIWSDAQKEALIQEIKEKLNLERVYEDMVAYARRFVTPQQVGLIRIISFFSKAYVSLILYAWMGINLFIILACTRSFYRSLFIVGGALVLAGSALYIGSNLIMNWLANVPLIVKEIVSLERQRMTTYATWYFGVGIGFILVYSLRIGYTQHQKKHQIE